MNITEDLRQRILTLDGAMGTMIQRLELQESDYRQKLFQRTPGVMKGNNDVLNLTRPDVVRDVHRAYLDAGADIIETNTFSSQRVSMADYYLADQAAEICWAGCRLAREEVDRWMAAHPGCPPKYVAGSVGPTNKSLSISPDVNNPALRSITFQQLSSAYVEQMRTMIDNGVDVLLVETIFDTLNAKAALFAAQQAMREAGRRLPVMLSVTVNDTHGRMLAGQTLEAFLVSVAHSDDILSVGLNCSFGVDQMLPLIRQLAAASPYYISVYPNAGLPNELGLYEETPEHMAQEMEPLFRENLVNVVGGCCGTTPEFIRRFADLAHTHSPHQPSRSRAATATDAPDAPLCLLAGLEPLRQTADMRFVNIGERCNVAGSRKFLRLIKEKQYDEALSIARSQIESGAMVLDVNMDDGLLDAEAEMRNFVNLMMSDPDVARVPLMIDSSQWNVVRAGLQCVQGKAIVNSISLKEGEEVFLEHAREIRRYGAAMVVMAFDEQGQATSYERKIAICQRAYRLLTEEAGVPAADIIFDPNVLAVGTGLDEHANYALDFIRATAWIRSHLCGAHVSGGVSNLSFSFRGNNYVREAMHAVFLYHTVQAGQDFGIVNPASKVAYEDVPAQLLAAIDDVLLNRRPDATERLIALASAEKAAHAEADAGSAAQAWRQDTSVESRLLHAIQRGIPDYLHEDLEEAMGKYGNALDIIQKPLMDAMNHVGELFGSGRMFLPQVVKSARMMKQAVALLQPHIEAGRKSADTAARKILMATVRGDVHDIGKNIVGVILACNGYEVVDLGVMVPGERIVDEAVRTHADIVALSGLITPSLAEMAHVAHLMQEAGLTIPLMIGGATTSELHTALKIATQYGGPVFWMHDAAQNVKVAACLFDPARRDAFIESNGARQERIRKEYFDSHQETLSLEEARRRKPHYFG